MKQLAKCSWIVLCLINFSFKVNQNNSAYCGIKNTAFKADETVTMRVFYTTLGAFISAGEATFTNTLERFNGHIVYHCVGEGKSYSFFDNFFKVRDKYESYIDTSNLMPYKFVRNVDEGGFKKYDNVSFNQNTGTAVSTAGVFKVSNCIQDIVSTVYYARNIDFNKYNINDKIPFDMFLDDEVYHLYIRYLGKEKIKTRYGKFNAIKIKPLLIKGSIFAGGEKMNAWLSDDPNHLLLRVESPIAVGSIKVDMMSYKNLKYPLSSLVSIN